MTRTAAMVVLGVLVGACASTTHYARITEAERSVKMAAGALEPGMTFYDVVVVMLNMRRPNQFAALESGRECKDEAVDVIVHASELLAAADRTQIRAGGFASLQTVRGTTLKSEGFERQGALLDALRDRQGQLLVCSTAALSFDAVTEGGCGRDILPLVFGANGRLTSVGASRSTECSH